MLPPALTLGSPTHLSPWHLLPLCAHAALVTWLPEPSCQAELPCAEQPSALSSGAHTKHQSLSGPLPPDPSTLSGGARGGCEAGGAGTELGSRSQLSPAGPVPAVHSYPLLAPRGPCTSPSPPRQLEAPGCGQGECQGRCAGQLPPGKAGKLNTTAAGSTSRPEAGTAGWLLEGVPVRCKFMSPAPGGAKPQENCSQS